MTKRSDAELFDTLYGRIWGALNRSDDPDLSQHERQLLYHIPPEGGVALSAVAAHLALPKSTASVLVKDLERRGFLRRRRDPADERRLAIVLTPKGRRRLAGDTVLRPDDLAAALDALPAASRQQLIALLGQVAAAAERRSEAGWGAH